MAPSAGVARSGELQGGRWVNQQVVPARWIRMSTMLGGAPDSLYGDHWWIRPRGYSAQGFGGQYIYILPAERLLVVVRADPNAGLHLHFTPVERSPSG